MKMLRFPSGRRSFAVALLFVAACGGPPFADAPVGAAAGPVPAAMPIPTPPPPAVPAPARQSWKTAAPADAMTEARALWVPRWDWETPADIRAVMAKAAAARFNLVYFQVRGQADAFYRSEIEPCAVRLCGRLGGTPTWDPLAVAVHEAHARGLELHAWLNALPGWPSERAEVCGWLRESTPGNPRHILLQHPEWAMRDAAGRRMPCPNSEENIEYVHLSPAEPGVRSQLARVTADVVRRYDVDGVHLDRIRYPGTRWSHDPASLAAFGRSPTADPEGWAQFRREQVNAVVREAHDSMQAVKPHLPLSAAVWPIYDRRAFGWPSSSGVAQFFQDPRAWARGGYLDVAAPMTYFTIGERRCAYVPDNPDWLCLVEDQVRGVQEGTGRHVYVGIAATIPRRKTVAEVEQQVQLARARGARGIVFWSYADVDRLGLWAPLAQGVFRRPAVVPRMDWLEGDAR